MVAYSFQRRFIAPIQAGTKVQTIREKGKRRHGTPGLWLQLYFAMRTKHCRKIIPDERCVRADRLRLNFGLKTVLIGPDGGILLQGRVELDRFAVLDGFHDFDDMDTFWNVMHPSDRFFDGVMVGWRPGFWA